MWGISKILFASIVACGLITSTGAQGAEYVLDCRNEVDNGYMLFRVKRAPAAIETVFADGASRVLPLADFKYDFGETERDGTKYKYTTAYFLTATDTHIAFFVADIINGPVRLTAYGDGKEIVYNCEHI